MATATYCSPDFSSTSDVHFGELSESLNKRSPAPSFIKFDEKQATVYVNSQHIVRLEYHAAAARAHLLLSDGHTYYLSEAMARRVIDQLEGCH